MRNIPNSGSIQTLYGRRKEKEEESEKGAQGDTGGLCPGVGWQCDSVCVHCNLSPFTQQAAYVSGVLVNTMARGSHETCWFTMRADLLITTFSHCVCVCVSLS